MDLVIEAYIRHVETGGIQYCKDAGEVRSLHRYIAFLRDLAKLEPEADRFRAALGYTRGNLKGTPFGVWLQQESGAHANHVFLSTGYRLTWENPRAEHWVPVFKRSDGCDSEIPGARADWAPSQTVTYEPDLGEDLEISTEEERAWRAKQ